MPRFSIIIPVYNVGKYISQCLDSICSQTFNDFEAIVVDDGCLGYMKAILSLKTQNKTPFNRFAERIEEGKRVVYREMYQSAYHPMRSFFVPRRCSLCIDHYGELADISFGDIHVEPYLNDKIGVNSVIVRNAEWLSILENARKEDVLQLDQISFETISNSQAFSFKKKGRNGAFVQISEKLGFAVPKYDEPFFRKPRIKDYIAFAHMSGQRFLGQHKRLWWLVKLLKGKASVDVEK